MNFKKKTITPTTEYKVVLPNTPFLSDKELEMFDENKFQTIINIKIELPVNYFTDNNIVSRKWLKDYIFHHVENRSRGLLIYKKIDYDEIDKIEIPYGIYSEDIGFIIEKIPIKVECTYYKINDTVNLVLDFDQNDGTNQEVYAKNDYINCKINTENLFFNGKTLSNIGKNIYFRNKENVNVKLTKFHNNLHETGKYNKYIFCEGEIELSKIFNDNNDN